jgi:SIR2-like domain
LNNRGKALLLGNGVNLLSNDVPSWLMILVELAKLNDCTHIMKLAKYKPYTLIYEEIALCSKAAEQKKEIEIKREVAELIRDLPPNDYHCRILEAPIDHILTTNYDYTLERSKGCVGESKNLRRENKYSAFRRRWISGKFVWHIHGEVDVPNTIMLGHEHYAGQLQKLRDYATSDRVTSRELKSPFKLGNPDFENQTEVYSWIDVFLRDEVHVIGTNLDYTEIDLWWLFAYKRRLGQISGYETGTTFFHHVPTPQDDQATEGKLSILESLGVNVVRHRVLSGYKYAYDSLLNDHLRAT